jgi:hypothetical protein
VTVIRGDGTSLKPRPRSRNSPPYVPSGEPHIAQASANGASSCSFSESAQPLTPTRTPTSATYVQTSFETPNHESSFYDPRVNWNTADPWATTPDFLKTPKYRSFTTPSQSPVLGLSKKRPLSGQKIEDEIASHVHRASPKPNLPLSSVEPSNQLPLSSQPSSSSMPKKRSGPPASNQTPTQHNLGVDPATDPPIRSAGSMQTPPPTSTSASRRKSQQVQTTKSSSGSAVNSRRMSTPTGLKVKKGEGLSSQVEESPLQLANLQFSPDGYGFSMSGFAGSSTVPAYPQHKLFWDPSQNTDGMNIDFADEAFSFGLQNLKDLDPFTSGLRKANVSHLPSSPSFDGLGMRSSRGIRLETLANQGPANQADFNSSDLMIRNVPKGVDPSLLFSSPSRPVQSSGPVESTRNEALQPYASQLRDAQIDKDSGVDRVSKRRRKLYDDSPAVKAALQALRDDTRSRTSTEETVNEDIPVQPRQGNLSTSRVASKSSESRRRLGSTRKAPRSAHSQASSRPPRRRTAVTLTIDENGRAKTETKIVPDGAGSSGPSSEANVDMDTGTDSESGSPSESDEMTISQPQSFAFSTHRAAKPKLARFVTDSKTHSQKSSYTSTLAPSHTGYSLAVSEQPERLINTAWGTNSSGRRDSPAKRRLQRRVPPNVLSDDIEGGRDIEIHSEVETVTSDDDRGDAQSELRKIVRVRAQSRPSTQAEARKSSVVYPSSGGRVPPELFGAMAFSQGVGANAFGNVSPTTITDPGLSTPGTGRDSLAGEATRCVCPGFEIEGELMILWYVKRDVYEYALIAQQRFVQELATCWLRRPQPSQTSSDLSVCVLHGSDPPCQGRAYPGTCPSCFPSAEFTSRTQISSVSVALLCDFSFVATRLPSCPPASVPCGVSTTLFR